LNIIEDAYEQCVSVNLSALDGWVFLTQRYIRSE